MNTALYQRLCSLVSLLAVTTGLNAQVADTSAAPQAATNAVQLEETEGAVRSNQTAVAPSPSAPVARLDRSRKDEVVVGRDVVVPTGETVREVVVLAGSAIIQGKVKQDVVVCGGHADITGEVGGDLVVLGSITVSTNGSVKGDVVGVGGKVDIANGRAVGGDVVKVNLGDLSAPAWLSIWFKQCLFKLRPLSFSVGWVWGVAGMCYLLYLLVAVLFPGPVRSCVAELTRRPATTFAMGLVTKLLVPVILFILLATGLGLFVIPFVLAALLVVGLIGKVALLEWMGFKVGAGLGGAGLKSPVLALLGGLVILTLLYLVPVVGFVTLALTGMWGLGAAVTAAFGGLRREMPDKSPRGLPPVPEPVVAGATVPGEPSPAVSTRSGPTPEANPLPGTFPHPPLQPAATAASQETATFWERMGAGFLDIVLVGILSGLVGGFPLGLLVGLAYFAGMWTWKGTTIGGIVLGLKVVRVDRRPVTFAVALVRSLAAAFSVVVLFLGFLWIAWDPAKQGWHDKIAGTTVVRSRNGMPLVCV